MEIGKRLFNVVFMSLSKTELKNVENMSGTAWCGGFDKR